MKKIVWGALAVLAGCGLGTGTVCAEDAVPAMEMAPPAVESQPMMMDEVKPCTTPAGRKCRSTQPCRDGKGMKGHCKSKELELDWNLAIGMATYEENDELIALDSMGINLEINPGIRVRTVPGLEFGTVVGFILINSTASESVEYDGPPEVTRNWDINATSVGTYLMAKYGYTFHFGMVELGLENGFGLGYFINSVSADWVNAEDSDDTGSESEDESGWAPIVKAGLKVDLPVSKVSRLGLNLGANLAPFTAGDYQCIANVVVGLNYQVAF